MIASRKEMLNVLKASRDWNNPDKESKNWQRAFQMFREATGEKIYDIQCSTCIGKVREWLLKD